MSESEAPAAVTITLSEVATSKVREVMDSQGLKPEERNLRVFVEGGGCGGMQFGLAFDQVLPEDTSFDEAGLNIIIDPVSLPYVNGATIDFVETPEVTGFKVTVPHAHAQGGCSPDSCGPAEQGAAGCGSGGCC